MTDPTPTAFCPLPSGTFPDGLPRPVPAIYPAMVKVLQAVDAVGKTRTNEQQKYKFRGIDDILNAVHPALSEAGIFLAPTVIDRHLDRTEKDKPGQGMQITWHCVLTVCHRFYAGDGSYVEVTTVGTGMDTSDKASNKALSAAFKYALVEAFSIPTVDLDDDEQTQSGPAPRGGAGPAVRQQATPAKPEPWTKEQLAEWTAWKTKITALAGGKERFTAVNGDLKRTHATFADYMAHFAALHDELSNDQPPH